MTERCQHSWCVEKHLFSEHLSASWYDLPAPQLQESLHNQYIIIQLQNIPCMLWKEYRKLHYTVKTPHLKFVFLCHLGKGNTVRSLFLPSSILQGLNHQNSLHWLLRAFFMGSGSICCFQASDCLNDKVIKTENIASDNSLKPCVLPVYVQVTI